MAQTLRAAMVVVALSSAAALAQTTSSTGFDAQLFKPQPGVSDVLGLQGSRVAERLQWQAGLFVNYASNPLVFVNAKTGERLGALVGSQTGFDLLGSVGLAKDFELGLALPLSLQSGDPAPVDGVAQPVSGFGLGDIRLIPKYRFFKNDKLGLAASIPLILPTGSPAAFSGSGNFGVQPRIAADYSLPNDFRFLANAGLTLQPTRTSQNLNVGNNFVWGAGTEIPIKIEQRDLAVLATIGGNVQLQGQGQAGNPIELDLAARYRIIPELAAVIGAGRGITAGYGTPDIRVFAGVTYGGMVKPPEKQEFVEPVKPACTTGPEDLDGFQDDDACADPDNDNDGISDTADVCPNDAETKNGYRDDDGCPDEKPAALPPLPKAATGDTDSDGIVDADDRCVNDAEDKDGFEDADGCPEADNDRDGIADGNDKCPLEAETINGVTDDDGCPDKGKSKVVVTAEKIVILDKVYFATDKAEILSKSFDVLKQVASVLKANPQLTHVRIEGHTDDQGDDAHNMDLSQRRAKSVATFLAGQGIEEKRLEPVGYGETKPVESNKTAKGREKNRRVEFTIVQDEVKEPPPDVDPVENKEAP